MGFSLQKDLARLQLPQGNLVDVGGGSSQALAFLSSWMDVFRQPTQHVLSNIQNPSGQSPAQRGLPFRRTDTESAPGWSTHYCQGSTQ